MCWHSGTDTGSFVLFPRPVAHWEQRTENSLTSVGLSKPGWLCLLRGNMKELLSAALEARQVSASLKDCWESRALSSQEGRGIVGSEAVPFLQSELCNTQWLSGWIPPPRWTPFLGRLMNESTVQHLPRLTD